METLHLFYFCAPTFVTLAVVAIALNYALRLLFKLAHLPNYTTHPPTSPLSWKKIPPADILFRLAGLAALNVVLFWMPIFYWTTYESCGDDRDGGLLFYSVFACPLSWVLGGICYFQVWRAGRVIQARFRAAFYIFSSLLLLVILSTVIPQIRLFL